jgi:hypothetical protein
LRGFVGHCPFRAVKLDHAGLVGSVLECI